MIFFFPYLAFQWLDFHFWLGALHLALVALEGLQQGVFYFYFLFFLSKVILINIKNSHPSKENFFHHDYLFLLWRS